MKSSIRHLSILFPALGMILLILDSRCAVSSAGQALALCLKTVIPTLFPMFVLSGLVISGLGAERSRLTGFLEDFLGLPQGTGSIFLVGTVGGFPVGAQCITQAVEPGSMSADTGERMLGFCNNCSPAFLFGIAGAVFSDLKWPLTLFLIQLETAMLIASFTTFGKEMPFRQRNVAFGLAEAVSRGCRSITAVCAWVILAGVVTGFLERWVYPLLPGCLPQILSGILEITGGVMGLSAIANEQIRFLLCSLFICFGGISVHLQIHSLATAGSLSTKHCIHQKMIQGILGFALAVGYLMLGPIMLIIPAGIPFLRKIILEKQGMTVYNNSHKGGFDHVVPKEN